MQDTTIAQIPVAGATEAVEAVIYRIKPEAMAGIAELRTRLMARASQMAGFRSAVFMSGVLENDLALDYVVWESLEHARRAAVEFERDPIYEPLMASVQEIVLLDHLQSLERLAGDAEPGNVFEVAVSTVRDGEYDLFTEKVPALAKRVTEQPEREHRRHERRDADRGPRRVPHRPGGDEPDQGGRADHDRQRPPEVGKPSKVEV